MSNPEPTGFFGARSRGGGDEGRMSFMEHLMELRDRLVRSVFIVFICVTVGLVFYDWVFQAMRQPLDDVNNTFLRNHDYRELIKDHGWDPNQPIVAMITTKPLSTMMIVMELAMWLGLVVASPFLMYEVWGFIAPGLKETEKRAIRPVLTAGVGFFLIGASICYFWVFPVTIEWLVWFDLSLGIRPSYTPEEFMDMLLTFMLIFGACFEIPRIVAIFSKLGLIKPEWLTLYWRAIILSCFVAGAILSPGSDVYSMLMMSGCLIFLYLFSVLMARIFYTKRGTE